jgi:hypothetical protein
MTKTAAQGTDDPMSRAGLALVLAGVALMIVAAGEPPPASAPLASDPTLPSVPAPALRQLSDDRIRQAIISQSIRRYGAECACPFQVDRHGRSCGSRAGKLAGPHHPKPLCKPAEVSDQQVNAWRERRRQ